MPPNSPINLLPLETFRQEVDYIPWHFWQLANAKIPLVASCSTLLREYSDQATEGAGRQQLRLAIGRAEQMLFDYLQFDVATRYNEDTYDVGFLNQIGQGSDANYPAWFIPAAGLNWSGSWGAGWNRQPTLLELDRGRVSRIATRTWTAVNDGPVTLHDYDGDNLKETFEATINDASTPLSDFGVFFAQADQPQSFPNLTIENWQIAPVTFSRSAGVVTASGPAWLLVPPVKYQGVTNVPGYNNSGIGAVDTSGAYNPDDPTSFVTTVSFYRKVYTNENIAYLDINDCGNITTYQMCAVIADRRTGQVRLDFNCCNGLPGGCPSTWNATQSIRINYEAGETLPRWQTIVTRLALAELRKRICACEQNNQEVNFWQEDLSRVATGGTEGFRVDNEAWGTRSALGAGRSTPGTRSKILGCFAAST
jgi:hypothetical protein